MDNDRLKQLHRIKLSELRKGNLAVLDYLSYNHNASRNIIEKTVCDVWNISRDSVFKRTRKRQVVEARQVIQYQFKNRLRMNDTDIGMVTGGYDRVTTFHNCKVVKNLIDNNKYYRKKFEQVEGRIDGTG